MFTARAPCFPDPAFVLFKKKKKGKTVAGNVARRSENDYIVDRLVNST